LDKLNCSTFPYDNARSGWLGLFWFHQATTEKVESYLGISA
jgi:hypothetical protein